MEWKFYGITNSYNWKLYLQKPSKQLNEIDFRFKIIHVCGFSNSRDGFWVKTFYCFDVEPDGSESFVKQQIHHI